MQKRNPVTFFLLSFGLLSALSCKNASGPWAAFTNCGSNACITEALDVKDALLANPQALLRQFDATYQKGEDHLIGWLYIMRDSVLLNPDFAATEERFQMQQAIAEAVKPYQNDPRLGEIARTILGEIEVLAIVSEMEDNGEPFLPITGTYQYDLGGKKGGGELLVSLQSGEAFAFKLSIVGPPPAYNQGYMEGMAFLSRPNVFEHLTAEFGEPCKLQFIFTENTAIIKTVSGDPASCGFGNGVVADQEYARTNFADPFLSGKDAQTAASLLGIWVSEDDPQSEVHIADGMYADVYDGEQLSSLPYTYFAKCPKNCNPIGATPCIKVMGQDDICYALIYADGKMLQLSMIGGRGNTLRYKKK